jgi:hypothetical protein
MRMKAGSLEPGFTIYCLSGGQPLDLTGATVTFKATQGIGLLFTDTSPTIDRPAGKVTHQWVSGQTDIPGRAFGWLEVDRGDGRKIIFPPYGFETIDFD